MTKEKVLMVVENMECIKLHPPRL